MDRTPSNRVEIVCQSGADAEALLIELGTQGWMRDEKLKLPGLRLGDIVVVEFPYEPGGPEITRLNYRPDVKFAQPAERADLVLLSPQEIRERAFRDMERV